MLERRNSSAADPVSAYAFSQGPGGVQKKDALEGGVSLAFAHLTSWSIVSGEGLERLTVETEAGGEGARPRAVSIEALTERYRPALLAFFRRRVNVPADAEDLVQEAFLRLAKPGRLQGIDNVESYVFQVATNLVRERARSRTARNADAEIILDLDIEDDQVFSPARIVESRDTVSRVLMALKELPERTRTIFILQRFEGLTYAEIAVRLALSQSAVEKNMSRAISHITRRMSVDV
jgi:RNA polymerase sigma-70 factor (ECF subfamily)